MRIFNRCWAVVLVLLFSVAPLAAQGDETPKDDTQIWVLSYAIMIGFLTLAVLILVRPTKRNESAFSFDEQKEKKEEEMKKIKGSH